MPTWAIAGGSLTGSYWSGGIHFFTEPNIASPATEQVVHNRPPLPDPSFSWDADDHGHVVGAKWIPGCEKIIAGCLDGSILQIDPVLLGPGSLPTLELADEETEEPTLVIFRHPHQLNKIDAKRVSGQTLALRAVAASSIGQISLTEVNVERAEASSSGQWAHAGRVSALALGPSFIVSAGMDGSCCVWDMRLKLNALQIGTKFDGTEPIDASSDVICSIGLDSSEGPLVATATLDENLHLYDLRKAVKPLLSRQDFNTTSHCLEFHPYLANVLGIGCDNGCVKMLDVRNNDIIYNTKLHSDKVRALAWNTNPTNTNGAPASPNNCLELISASWDFSVLSHKRLV